jgi:hypothetical protein
MLVLDGLYVDRPDGAVRVWWVKAPTSDVLTQLTRTIARRVGRCLECAEGLNRSRGRGVGV